MNSYVVGEQPRLKATFKIGSTPTDPTTISLIIKAPSGAETTYTYSGGQVIKDSTGVYHYDLPLTAAGKWSYRWIGTGTVVTATESSFLVVTNF